MTNTARLEERLTEATVDCYGLEEEFRGILYTLADNLNFPLVATALGEAVEVIGLDDNRSSPSRGILATVRKGDREYQLALSELEFTAPDPVSAEWLAMYHYWLG